MLRNSYSKTHKQQSTFVGPVISARKKISKLINLLQEKLLVKKIVKATVRGIIFVSR